MVNKFKIFYQKGGEIKFNIKNSDVINKIKELFKINFNKENFNNEYIILIDKKYDDFFSLEDNEKIIYIEDIREYNDDGYYYFGEFDEKPVKTGSQVNNYSLNYTLGVLYDKKNNYIFSGNFIDNKPYVGTFYYQNVTIEINKKSNFNIEEFIKKYNDGKKITASTLDNTKFTGEGILLNNKNIRTTELINWKESKVHNISLNDTQLLKNYIFDNISKKLDKYPITKDQLDVFKYFTRLSVKIDDDQTLYNKIKKHLSVEINDNETFYLNITYSNIFYYMTITQGEERKEPKEKKEPETNYLNEIKTDSSSVFVDQLKTIVKNLPLTLEKVPTIKETSESINFHIVFEGTYEEKNVPSYKEIIYNALNLNSNEVKIDIKKGSIVIDIEINKKFMVLKRLLEVFQNNEVQVILKSFDNLLLFNQIDPTLNQFLFENKISVIYDNTTLFPKFTGPKNPNGIMEFIIQLLFNLCNYRNISNNLHMNYFVRNVIWSM